MKNGVTINKINYIINPEKKIIICIMQCYIDYHKTLPKRDVYSYMWRKRLPYIDHKGDFTVKAIAKCSKEDTFNKTIGKKLAESRANLKAFKIAAKFYDAIYSYYNGCIHDVSTMKKILIKTVESEENYLKTLI